MFWVDRRPPGSFKFDNISPQVLINWLFASSRLRVGGDPGAMVKCASRIVIPREGLGQRNNKGKETTDQRTRIIFWNHAHITRVWTRSRKAIPSDHHLICPH